MMKRTLLALALLSASVQADILVLSCKIGDMGTAIYSFQYGDPKVPDNMNLQAGTKVGVSNEAIVFKLPEQQMTYIISRQTGDMMVSDGKHSTLIGHCVKHDKNAF
jgi:hypothetical protein